MCVYSRSVLCDRTLWSCSFFLCALTFFRRRRCRHFVHEKNIASIFSFPIRCLFFSSRIEKKWNKCILRWIANQLDKQTIYSMVWYTCNTLLCQCMHSAFLRIKFAIAAGTATELHCYCCNLRLQLWWLDDCLTI